MTPFELVIFDCDGVLVDSEPIIIDVLADMLGKMGHPVRVNEIYDHFHGRSPEQWLTEITAILGAPPSKTFVATLQQRAADDLRTKITPIDGVSEALDAIDLPVCVASSGSHEKMQLTLGKTGLLSRFGSNIFSVSEVERPKPYPDVYLHAAYTNRVAPSNCVVIEDSPTGVRAGVAANMTVFGFCAQTSAHRLHEAGAHRLFSDMRELPSLLSMIRV